MRSEQLTELLRLTEVAFAAEQSKLARLNNQEQAVRDQLSSLKSSRRLPLDATVAAPSPAVRAGAEVRWHRWIDTRREVLNRELAQLLAHRARSIAAVSRAFGKKEALAALVAKAKAEELQKQARRQDYMS